MFKEIPLTRGKVALVDVEDFEWLSEFKWHLGVNGYASTNTRKEDGSYTRVYMHRMIMNPPTNMVVDHINRNKCDNRKENLRIVTYTQNTWNTTSKNTNTSEYKGVSKTSRGKFMVQITAVGKERYIGSFTNEIAAANAYNYHARKYYDEHAYLNDVPFMSEDEWRRYRDGLSSQFRGVYWHAQLKKWAVAINGDKKKTHFFEDEIVAANYYNHRIGEMVNDCRYISLEECEKQEKIFERTSKYRGVSWYKSRKLWVAKIFNGERDVCIGYFESEKDAALAYNQKAIELNVKNLHKKLNKVD